MDQEPWIFVERRPPGWWRQLGRALWATGRYLLTLAWVNKVQLACIAVGIGAAAAIVLGTAP